MTLTLAPCGPYPWPHAECVHEHRALPAPRPAGDDYGLTVDHGDTRTAAELAALAATAAAVLAGAFVGGTVLLGFGILERLLRKLP